MLSVPLGNCCFRWAESFWFYVIPSVSPCNYFLRYWNNDGLLNVTTVSKFFILLLLSYQEIKEQEGLLYVGYINSDTSLVIPENALLFQTHLSINLPLPRKESTISTESIISKNACLPASCCCTSPPLWSPYFRFHLLHPESDNQNNSLREQISRDIPIVLNWFWSLVWVHQRMFYWYLFSFLIFLFFCWPLVWFDCLKSRSLTETLPF